MKYLAVKRKSYPTVCNYHDKRHNLSSVSDSYTNSLLQQSSLQELILCHLRLEQTLYYQH